jgi:hypothetical protein
MGVQSLFDVVLANRLRTRSFRLGLQNKVKNDSHTSPCSHGRVALKLELSDQDPDFWEYWKRKGHALTKLGKEPEAKFCYDKAFELREKNELKLGVVLQAITTVFRSFISTANDCLLCYFSLWPINSSHSLEVKRNF